jgi:signal transduction histidine kinase
MDGAPPFHILIVEDDEGTCANLRDILELDDYRVETAGTAAAALDRADWAGISAIILDRRLPDSTAEQLLPRLRQRAPEAAVIIVTGYGDLEGAIAAMRQGAVDYLLKPINPDLLRASLARLAERQRLAAALEEARRRALQAERLAAIGEVYTGLAHESRNALQRSQACLEMLAGRVKDVPGALDLIARIQNAQDHLHHLYEEVRTYAAPMTAGRRQPCHLGELLRQTWEHLAPQWEKRQARLDQTVAELDLICRVDPYQIEQVYRNILENALAASEDPVVICATWTETAVHGRPGVQAAIRDSGPGLSLEARRRIFEPFFTTKTRGTGLGMAIAWRIVEAHGGCLAVSESAGPGAEILVTLPRGEP